ncbi:hypothetical protein SRHO_G00203080 [Serrasalmus rhombeus]
MGWRRIKETKEDGDRSQGQRARWSASAGQRLSQAGLPQPDTGRDAWERFGQLPHASPVTLPARSGPGWPRCWREADWRRVAAQGLSRQHPLPLIALASEGYTGEAAL